MELLRRKKRREEKIISNTRIQDYIGNTVQLKLKDGSVLNGTIISKGITRGLAIRSTLSSSPEWPFRAEDIQTLHLTTKD